MYSSSIGRESVDSTYVLPIFRLLFACGDFLHLANFFGFLELLLSCLEETAGLDRDELHWVVGGLWWCCSCNSLLLNVVCVLDGNLEKQFEAISDDN